MAVFLNPKTGSSSRAIIIIPVYRAVEIGFNILKTGEARLWRKSTELMFEIEILADVVIFFKSRERAGATKAAPWAIASICVRFSSPRSTRSPIVEEESTCKPKRHGCIRFK